MGNSNEESDSIGPPFFKLDNLYVHKGIRVQ